MYQIAYTQHHPANVPISEALMFGGAIVQQRDCPVRVTEVESRGLLLAVSGGLYPRSRPDLASLHALGAARAFTRVEAGGLSTTRRTPEFVIGEIHTRFCASMQSSHPDLKAGASLATLHLRRGKAICISVGDVRVYRCSSGSELVQFSRDQTFAQSRRDHGEMSPEAETDSRLHRAEHALLAGGEFEPPPAQRFLSFAVGGDTFALLSREAWVSLGDDSLAKALSDPDLRGAIDSLRHTLIARHEIAGFSILAARCSSSGQATYRRVLPT